MSKTGGATELPEDWRGELVIDMRVRSPDTNRRSYRISVDRATRADWERITEAISQALGVSALGSSQA